MPYMRGDTLRRERIAWDYTQEIAAALIGVDVRTIRRWENDERNIPEPVTRLVMLMRSLDVREALGPIKRGKWPDWKL